MLTLVTNWCYLFKGNKVTCLVNNWFHHCFIFHFWHYNLQVISRPITSCSFFFVTSLVKDDCNQALLKIRSSLLSGTAQVLDQFVVPILAHSLEMKTDPGRAGPARSLECPSQAPLATQLTCRHGNCAPRGFPRFHVFHCLLAGLTSYSVTLFGVIICWLCFSCTFNERGCRIYCAAGWTRSSGCQKLLVSAWRKFQRFS